jgi:hypothetical protein
MFRRCFLLLIAHNLIFLCFFPSVWYRKWDKNLLLSAEKPAPLFNIMQRSFYVMEVIRKSGNRKGEIPARKKLMPALKMTENICFQGV